MKKKNAYMYMGQRKSGWDSDDHVPHTSPQVNKYFGRVGVGESAFLHVLRYQLFSFVFFLESCFAAFAFAVLFLLVNRCLLFGMNACDVYDCGSHDYMT